MARLGICLIALLFVGGCSLLPSSSVRDDPLLGKIIDTISGDEITFAELVERMANNDVIYLGENHDNAIHHARQKQSIEALVARGLKPAIGFEFFDIAQTGYLTQYVSGTASAMALHSAGAGVSAEQRLRKQLGWAERKDSEWQFYFQLIELARVHQLPVFGADLPASIKLRLSRVGVAGLNAVEQGQLLAIKDEVPGYRAFMYHKFRQGHCGWGEEALLARLYDTWNQRNGRMAQSIVRMAERYEVGPVVVILGNGHIEYNLAVVERVRLLAPTLKQLNLGMQAISIDPQPLQGYLDSGEVEGPLWGPRHDLLWFSQRTRYNDPCAKLNKPG